MPSAILSLNMNKGVCHYMKCKNIHSFQNVNEILPIWKPKQNSHPSNPIQIPPQIHMQKMQLPWFFNIKEWKMQEKSSKTLSLCSKYKTQAQQDTETKKSNALMEKQKG